MWFGRVSQSRKAVIIERFLPIARKRSRFGFELALSLQLIRIYRIVTRKDKENRYNIKTLLVKAVDAQVVENMKIVKR